jgi:hypothetical protein
MKGRMAAPDDMLQKRRNVPQKEQKDKGIGGKKDCVGKRGRANALPVGRGKTGCYQAAGQVLLLFAGAASFCGERKSKAAGASSFLRNIALGDKAAFFVKLTALGTK